MKTGGLFICHKWIARWELWLCHSY